MHLALSSLFHKYGHGWAWTTVEEYGLRNKNSGTGILPVIHRQMVLNRVTGETPVPLILFLKL